MAEIHVSLPSDVLFQIGPVEVTNSVTAAVVVSLILMLFALWLRKGAGLVPTKRQVFFEFLYEIVYEQLIKGFGDEKRAKQFFPLFMTIFLFIALANQFAFIPFLQSVFVDHAMAFRVPTSDYSLTITLMIVVVILSANLLAFVTSPSGYIGNFVRVKSLWKPIRNAKKLGFKGFVSEVSLAGIDFGIGLMEVIGEVAKCISLATRLFGNIFAGEVLVAVITGLVPFTQFVFAWPFLAVGFFVGFVQAFLFVVLGVIYISLSLNAVSHSHSNGH